MMPEEIVSRYGFDTVGAVTRTSDNVLILGFETRPERDLDEFLGGGRPRTLGFENHFVPMVRPLWDEIRERGYAVRQERDVSFPIKRYALFAGIGYQGKNTLILHPIYGARLRFIALVMSMPIASSRGIIYKCKEQRLSVRCYSCASWCVRRCPVQALTGYRLPDKTKCIAYEQLADPTPNEVHCNACWKACEASDG
jgi:hypothetical protein